MAYRFVTTDVQGIFYNVQADGQLTYFRDQSRDGTANWANGGIGQPIGAGWDGFNRVVNGGDGVLYALNPADDLLLYKDLARNGTPNWANGGAGQVIGHGWSNLLHVAPGGDGSLYVVNDAGDLLYYKDLARDGTVNWANGGVGQVIGHNWGDYLHVVSGGDGILYAVTGQGDLLYFRDVARDGTVQWAFDGAGQTLAAGWHVYEHVLGAGDGVLYAITADGGLLFFRDLGRDGTRHWANQGVGQLLTLGWQIAWHAATDPLGYCWPLSAAPGEKIDFHVSSPSPYAVTIMRYQTDAVGTNVGVAVAAGPNQPAAALPTPPLAWHNGCDWPVAFQWTVPAGTASGIYAAECQVAGMPPSAIVFVVKPAPAASGDFLTLANTNTWNAYNDYGGRSKYTTPPAAQLSWQRPNPGAWPQGATHLTAAELWLHTWLRAKGCRLDVVADLDFHRGVPGLQHYKAIILTTHPEYWTMQMLDKLQTYLDGGGNLLYLGGNGLYEEVTFSPDGKTLTLLHGDAATPRPQCLYRNRQPPRNERAFLGVAYDERNYDAQWAAYKVLEPAHPFLAPLGLAVGDLIGTAGYANLSASGWEMDTSDGPARPPNLHLLARGANVGADGTVYGADMTYFDTPAGGFVFAVGSLGFSSSLPVDAALQVIVGNALEACLQT